MSMLRLLSQRRLYVCQQCIRRQHTLAPDATAWAALRKDRKARQATWDERAGRIKAGAEKSMLSALEERGYVKDVAG
jgi:tyrosyl-tRNA synthetase